MDSNAAEIRPPAAVSATLIDSFLERKRDATASAAVLRTAGGNDIMFGQVLN